MRPANMISRRRVSAPRVAIGSRRAVRPCLENLEDRRLLSFNVFEFATSTPAALPTGVAFNSGVPGVKLVAGDKLFVAESGRNKIAVLNAATLTTIQEVDIPTPDSSPFGMTNGPDGKVWFTEAFAGKIGVLDPTTLSITEFPLSSDTSGPTGITTGPDGKIWFTESTGDAIGVIDPTTHAIDEFPLASSGAFPLSIAEGPDAKLWFTNLGDNAIGVIDPTTHAIDEFKTPGNLAPFGITAGSDGLLWFTEPAPAQVVSIDPTSHAFTEYAVPTPNSEPTGITTGTDGNIWFTESLGNKIGTMDLTTKDFTEYDVPTLLSVPLGIVAAPDGSFYFTEAFGSKVGHVSTQITDRIVTDAALPNPGGGQYGIVTGPDQNLWFTESLDNKLGMINPKTHVVNQVDIPTPGSRPLGITTLGGKLWFVEGVGNIASYDPSTGTFQTFAIPTQDSGPVGITVGPDGQLWFTEARAGVIGTFDTVGETFNEISLSSTKKGPLGITTGPDGNVWFTELTSGQIGMIDAATRTVHEYPLPSTNNGPWSIVSGPGDLLWFTEAGGNAIGSIDPTSKAIHEYAVPGSMTLPLGLTAGSDGNLWFTEALGDNVGSFDPNSQTFEQTSVPTSLSGLSGITSGPDGNVWFNEFVAGNVGLVQLVQFPTTTSLTESASNVLVGQPVTFTATVTPEVAGALDGSVVFTIDGTAQTPVAVKLVGGVWQATFTTSSLGAGTHVVDASYGSDTAYAPSLSNSVHVTVSRYTTSTQLVANATDVSVGTPITFTATVVTASPSAALSARGVHTLVVAATVTLLDGTTPIATLPLDANGQAIFQVSSLAPGTHFISALFNGDATRATSQSPAVEVMVRPAVITDGPTISGVDRVGYHAQPTSLVVHFSRPLDVASAQNLQNYVLLTGGGRRLRIRNAHYVPETNSVVLTPAGFLSLRRYYYLSVIGTPPNGVRDTNGLLLDGANTGQPGSNYLTMIDRHNLVILPRGPRAALRRHARR